MHQQPARRLVVIVTLFLLLPFVAAAATALEKVDFVVSPTVSPWVVDFAVSGNYESLTLSVNEPDGRVSRTAIDAAGSISFYLVDDEGEQRPDGLYVYELHGMDLDGHSVLLRSGYFSVVEGSFLSPHAQEATAFDKVTEIADDLVVVGSTCVGLDCSASETFGFDTIKMKENNTRLMFQDTSNSGTFPSTDWMLRANETVNGGANLFSIVNCANLGSQCEGSPEAKTPFTILSGAPDNALYLDDQGDLGLGTATPAYAIHMVGGNTPTLRLEQDASSGFTAQTWDIGANEVNFFLRDVNGGGNLPFRVLAGAPRDALVVDGAGEIGLGTDSPVEILDVRGNVAVTGTVDGRDVAADGSTLDAHVADFANPHQVTAAQAGADAAGTAAAALAAHEASFDHSTLPSALPVPVAEGGTGATDAATARANLGIEDDPTKAGIVAAVDFSGNPATATVTFQTAFDPGTSYVVLLTAATTNPMKTQTPNVSSQDETGFTVTLGGQVGDLSQVFWLARPVGE